MKRFCLFLLAAGPFAVRAQLPFQRWEPLKPPPGGKVFVRSDTLRLRPWTTAPEQQSPRISGFITVRLLAPDRMPCLTVSRRIEPMPVDRRGNADRMVYRKRTELFGESGVNR